MSEMGIQLLAVCWGDLMGQAAPMPGCICRAVHEQVQQGQDHLITQILLAHAIRQLEARQSGNKSSTL